MRTERTTCAGADGCGRDGRVDGRVRTGPDGRTGRTDGWVWTDGRVRVDGWTYYRLPTDASAADRPRLPLSITLGNLECLIEHTTNAEESLYLEGEGGRSKSKTLRMDGSSFLDHWS